MRTINLIFSVSGMLLLIYAFDLMPPVLTANWWQMVIGMSLLSNVLADAATKDSP